MSKVGRAAQWPVVATDSSVDYPVPVVIEGVFRKTSVSRSIVGFAFVVCGLAVGAGLLVGVLSHGTFSRAFAFQPLAQRAIDRVQTGLTVAGAVLLPASLLLVGGAKLMARRNSLAAQMDSWSSYELTDLGERRPGATRRVLRALFAGGIPIIAAAGVCLAILTTSIGNEVSDGPNRPIEAVLQRLAPGNELIVGYAGAMPMVESDVSLHLARRVLVDAARHGVPAHLLRVDLGSLGVDGKALAALTIGIDVPRTSPLYWSSGAGCRLVPAEVDQAAGTPVGSVFRDDGSLVRVVKTTSGVSAINRIGVVMDQHAVATCLQKDPTAPVHAVVLATNPGEAARLLRAADSNGETATVISAHQYLTNSETFWTANVKPITNILALVSGLVALVAMAGSVAGRILRNRRELAAKLAAGASSATLRGTEVLRAAKDGLIASILGTALALIIVPLTNATESGLQAGISRNDVLVGCAVGLLGCLGGALLRTARFERAVNVKESTRV